MKNNNGKVAIAIVAMFVVALSVVGFTYAYFTAQVQGNLKQTESVEVGAGIMKVSYDYTNKLAAKNLVPGWISDEYHYYDPLLSVDDTTVPGKRIIYAATLDADKNLRTGTGLTEAPKYTSDTANVSMVSKPVSFTVTNTGNQKANYSIKLTNIEYSFDTIDEDNLLVYLFEGNWNGKPMTDKAKPDADYVTEGNINADIIQLDKTTAKKVFAATTNADGKKDLVLSGVESLEVGQSQSYYVVLHYVNADADQNASMGDSFSAAVEIVGEGQDA